jgi:DegV family protein with EDD domain
MVAVVADSAANIPEPVARELRIGLVPMYLRFGDEVYRDGADLTPADFYDRLVRDRVLASTSTPSPGDFLEAYRATGDTEVVCVTVASVMSAVHQEATLGAERFDGRVEIVDSKSASMAEGFVAMEAARLASNGASLERVAARAREIAGRTTLLATVDTFEFLRRSGRVTKLQAYAATMLDIKPVFRFHGGEVSPVARPRTRSRAVRRVVDDTLAEIAGRRAHVAVIHAAASDDAASIMDRVAAGADVVERAIVAVTPVIGAHTGPGLVGTAFYCDEPENGPGA